MKARATGVKVGVSLALCALVLAGCGGTSPNASGALPATQIAARVASKHLQRQLTLSPGTIDPAMNQDVAAYSITDDLFEGLVRLDAQGRVVPGVASRWETSADGLTWRFFLRPEALWSNGDAVTAQDFVFAWQRAVDPATASPNMMQFAPIAGAAAVLAGKAQRDALAVRAIDARTLEVKLAAPTPYFLYLLTNGWMMPLHGATVRQHQAAWTDPEHIVGNGAFVLRARATNGPIELVRNARYWDAAAVRLQAVTYHPLPDTAAATARFLTGDIDVAERFQMDDIQWLRAALGAEQVRLDPAFATYLLAMKVRQAPFDDVRLRQALSMAVDRRLITDKLLGGWYEPASSMVPPLPGYEPMAPEWAKLDDEARHREARRLYAEAGYSAARPLRAQLWYPTSDADSRRLVEAMAAMWRMNLGADVQPAGEEWKVFQQNREIGKHALFFYAYWGDYPDPLTFLNVPLPGGSYNMMQYDSAAYARAVSDGMQATDEPGRYARYREAENILNRDAVFIPVYYYRTRHLVRSYVHGWSANAMDRHASRDLYLAAEPAR
ncbi:MAG TPA: peptide ABC transporter substrate-binding protein [Steroidobacteraceae bacterium]|nr:peptide ABC transporter substrate-binding protein [Steroidobacteraceae bacterium]